MAKWGAGGGSWSAIVIPDVDDLLQREVLIRVPGDGGGDMLVPNFHPRVRDGMDLLDKVAWGWHRYIEVERLNLEDENTCLLGQAWPHYARMHNLVAEMRRMDHRVFYLNDTSVVQEITIADDTPYRQMLLRLFSFAEGDAVAQSHFAASIGCTLSTDDFELLNGLTKVRVRDLLGRDPAETGDWQRCADVGDELVHLFFEHLTRTWVEEIQRGHATGRWNATRQPIIDLRTGMHHLDDLRVEALLR